MTDHVDSLVHSTNSNFDLFFVALGVKVTLLGLVGQAEKLHKFTGIAGGAAALQEKRLACNLPIADLRDGINPHRYHRQQKAVF